MKRIVRANGVRAKDIIKVGRLSIEVDWAGPNQLDGIVIHGYLANTPTMRNQQRNMFIIVLPEYAFVLVRRKDNS